MTAPFYLRLGLPWAFGLMYLAACGGGAHEGAVGDGGSDEEGIKTPPEVLARLPGFASGRGGPMGIVIANGFAYVAVFKAADAVPVVARLPLAGGALEPLVPGPGSSSALGLDAAQVYFSDETMQAVRSVPLTGGVPQTVTDEIGGDEIVVAGGVVYVSDANVGATGRVAAVPVSGGALRELLSNQERPLALGLAGDILYVGHLGPTSGKNDMAQLLRVELGSGVASQVAGALEGVRSLVVDERAVYATVEGRRNGEGKLIAIERSTGALSLLADGQPEPWGLVGDAHALYWVNRGVGAGNGSVRRIAKTGGPVTTIASAQGEPRKCALAGGFIYWTNFSSGEVMRAGKAGP